MSQKSDNQKINRLRFFYQYIHELVVLIILVAVIVYWFQTVDSFEGHLTFFYIYYYITFSKNIIATYLASLLCYIILGRRQWKNRSLNALLSVVTISIMILLIESPAILGWVDYSTLFVPKMLGGPGPHNRQLEPTGYFHRPPYDQFSNALPGDATILLGFNSSRRYYAEHFFDQNGFRNNKDLEKATVVLLGDSFVEGYKVTQEEIVSNHLRQLIDVEVSNLGQGDFGPEHELAVLHQIGLDLKPSVVVWFFFEGNDLYDLDNMSLSIAGMFRFKERSFFLNILRIAASWTNQFVHPYMDLALKHSAQLRVHPKSTMYLRLIPYSITKKKLTQFEQFQEVIREAKTVCDQNDIKFLLVYVPIKMRVYQELLVFSEKSAVGDWDSLNDLPEMFAQWSEETDMHYLDLTHSLQQAAGEGLLVYFLDDEHWTSTGHEKVAQQVAVYLRENGLLEEKPHEIDQ